MNTDTMRFHTSRRYSKHPPNILVKHKPASTESVENIPSHLLQWSQSGSLHPPHHQTEYQSIIYAFYSLSACKTHSSTGPLQKKLHKRVQFVYTDRSLPSNLPGFLCQRWWKIQFSGKRSLSASTSTAFSTTCRPWNTSSEGPTSCNIRKKNCQVWRLCVPHG